MENITIVTGLWNINRGTMSNAGGYDWCRSFEKYTDQLKLLLMTGLSVIVFGDEEVEPIVAKYSNAIFILYPKEKFQTEFPYFSMINEIRTSPEWYNQPTAQWLKSSPQALLPLYAPIQFSKLYFVQRAAERNPFNSSRFYWMDAGICKNHDPALIRTMIPKLLKYNNFMFLSHYYTDNTEIHGFLRDKVHTYCGVPFVDRIMKGFFWGGAVDRIGDIVALYTTILETSLSEKLMGVDETIFTIMVNQRPELFDKVIIRGCDNTTQYL